MNRVDVPADVMWQAMTGLQARFSVGEGSVRRFAPGFSAIVAFENPAEPDFATLSRYCEVDEPFYVDCWDGEIPTSWALHKQTTMVKMVWDAHAPSAPESFGAVPLGPEHAAAALELAILTNPGPFGIRTPELGDYFGVFEDGQLIAMAGERFAIPGMREVSGVCTHPTAQGRGLARRLMSLLVRAQLERGETPFLHVLGGNEVALGLYRKMGFRDSLETVVRVLSRVG